jgi:oxidase EvaA
MDVLEQIAITLQGLRMRAPTVEVCALERMPSWRFDTGNPITMTDGHLSIRHIRVHAETREVTGWDQPIFDNDFELAVDLECGRADNTLQFGFRPCWEPGLHAGAELAPTRAASLAANTFPGLVRLTVRQSNEGGRFFRDVANYRVFDVGEARPDDNVIWLTLAEVHALLPRGFFNIEARSAISLLLSLA